ncbi:MAG: ABC transporter ATP-binding protein [Synergistota bacterium]|jgi:branched-chain amino acid transport system ATP-binding protein|nr:ABC transporter ATP-binding protein [Synergistota bacterium]
MLLDVKELNVHYGVIHALQGVSMEVEEGEIVALLGANGAGKTTTLSSISNLVPKTSGRVFFQGMDITNQAAHTIVEMGLGHVPEGRHVFSGLTVKENLIMGGYTRKRSDIERGIERSFTLFPRLRERSEQIAGTLSGGEQQMLVMARGLMSHPRMLLLDEPSMGLAPLIVEEVFKNIQLINDQGTSILLVEQNAEMALSIAHRAYVLETGKIVASGLARDLSESQEIQAVYLGG